MAATSDAPAPKLSIRLLWWFGIYFAAQLPLIPCIFAWVGPHPSPWIWFIFPSGLAWWLFIVTGGFIPQSNGITNAVEHHFLTVLSEYFVIALMVVPWIGYVVHLVYSLRVEKRRTFLILMWVLGAIVLFNLGSCASFLHDPPA